MSNKTSDKAPKTVALATSSTLATTTTVATGSQTPVKPAKKKVTELECTEIRWFYLKPGETNKWTAFRGHDSMALELTYRSLNNIPLDSYAKEIAAQFPISEKISLFDNLYEWDPKNSPDQITSIYWKDDAIKIRRGTWFYADTLQPLDADIADEIEKHHLSHFRNQTIPTAPVFNEGEQSKRPVLTTVKWGDYDEIKWNSVIDVILFNNTKANKFVRLLVTRAKGVCPLKRGFHPEADIEDGRPEFSDLILVVHGIGQKGYEHLIAKNTTQIRETVHCLMQKKYPNEKRRPMILPIEWRSSLVLDGDMTDTITLQRMMGLRNTINSVAMDIMYYQSPMYRKEIIDGVTRCLNLTYKKFIQSHPKFNGPVSIFAHSLGSVICYDILTNWSPLILYEKFITKAIEEKRNSANEEERQMYDAFCESREKLLKNDHNLNDLLANREEQLIFKAKYLFCIGSPLGVFIVMRGNSSEFFSDNSNCEQIVNIFHPYDPVAYRLEPLFHSSYKLIRPVRLFTYVESNRDYDKLPFELHKNYLRKMRREEKQKDPKKEAGKTGSENLQKGEVADEQEEEDDDDDSDYSSNCGSPRSKSPVVPEHEQAENAATASNPSTSGRWWRFGASGASTDVKKEEKEDEKKSPEKKVLLEKNFLDKVLESIPENKRIPRRFDFCLQTSAVSLSYLSAMNAHFNYWTNIDLVAFILNRLYANTTSKDEQPEPSGGDKADGQVTEHKD